LIQASHFDWTRQLFSQPSIKQNIKEVENKAITTPECWVDYLLAVHFGMLAIAKQLGRTLNMDYNYIVKLWFKYLGNWKDLHIVSSFTNERHGGLQINKD